LGLEQQEVEQEDAHYIEHTDEIGPIVVEGGREIVNMLLEIFTGASVLSCLQNDGPGSGFH